MRQLREEKYSAGVEGTWIKVGEVFVRGEGKYGERVERNLRKGKRGVGMRGLKEGERDASMRGI